MFDRWCGARSREKRLPGFWTRLSKPQLALLLAAYFSGGINGQYAVTTAHAWEDYYKNNNVGDYQLGNAAYNIGAQLQGDPSLLKTIGNMIRQTICKS